MLKILKLCKLGREFNTNVFDINYIWRGAGAYELSNVNYFVLLQTSFKI